MGRERSLKSALQRHKGVDQKLEQQKRLQKKAAKEKRVKRKTKDNVDDDDVDGDVDIDLAALERAVVAAEAADKAAGIDPTKLHEEELAIDAVDGEAGDYGTDESEDGEEDEEDEEEDGDDDEKEDEEEDESEEDGGVPIGALEDDDEDTSDSEIDDGPGSDKPRTKSKVNGATQDEDADEAEEDDIPLSDLESLASDDRGDVIPHQRLTIYNAAALKRSLASFALPSDLPFSATQAVTTAVPVEIPDVEDDLNRELSFYKQSLDAVKEARAKLKEEGVPFSRPADYFAEMVKSEEQMGRVRQKQVDEAARKKASAEARRQRDLKKFGKAVQVAKLQERDKAKRDTLDKINALKRKRQGAELNTNEDDMFDVALEDAAETEKVDRGARRAKTGPGGPPNRKRQKKDEKYGFGGKKRYAKSNDAKSAGDMRDYSVRKMKGKAGKPQRPGKNRRARMT